MASAAITTIKRRRVNLSVAQKLELIKKLESGVSVAQVCHEYGVKKQTVCDIRKSKQKLMEFASKYNVNGHINKTGLVNVRKHMKVARDKRVEDAVYHWYMRKRACGVNVRGVELTAAANDLAQNMNIPFKASDGWLWRFRNRHGFNKKRHNDSENNITENVELFRTRLNKYIENEGLQMSQIYRAEEMGLFWKSFPESKQIFSKVNDLQINKNYISILCCVNADGIHRVKPLIVGKSSEYSTLNNAIHHLPVFYYVNEKAMLTSEIFSEWFFDHFISDVRKYQMEVLKFHPEDVKALLLINKVTTYSDVENLISADGKVQVMFLTPDCASAIQPIDQSVVASCKRLYFRKFLEEILITPDDEDRLKNESRTDRLLQNLANYNLKSAIFNFAASWKNVKKITIVNSWKRLLSEIDSDVDFDGIKASDFQCLLYRSGEKNITTEDVEIWLDENLKSYNHELDDDNDSNYEKSPVNVPKIGEVRNWIDNIINYIDASNDNEVQAYYEHFRAFREIIIREQNQCSNKLKPNLFLESIIPINDASSPSDSKVLLSPFCTPVYNV